jgi:hypothetical protein
MSRVADDFCGCAQGYRIEVHHVEPRFVGCQRRLISSVFGRRGPSLLSAPRHTLYEPWLRHDLKSIYAHGKELIYAHVLVDR